MDASERRAEDIAVEVGVPRHIVERIITISKEPSKPNFETWDLPEDLGAWNHDQQKVLAKLADDVQGLIDTIIDAFAGSRLLRVKGRKALRTSEYRRQKLLLVREAMFHVMGPSVGDHLDALWALRDGFRTAAGLNGDVSSKGGKPIGRNRAPHWLMSAAAFLQDQGSDYTEEQFVELLLRLGVARGGKKAWRMAKRSQPS